jgi:hypothetical protein
MRCSGSTLLEGEWQVRLPVEQHTNVTIIDKGEPVDSFEAGFGFDPKLFEKKDKPNGDDQSQQRSSAKSAREPLPSRRRLQLQIKLDRNASASTDTDVSGTYELLPKCFGALGSLHKRTATDGTAEQRPLYFFLDPKSVGPAEKDCFVFAHDWRRLAYAQTRTSTVLTLDHTFRAKAEKDAKAEEDVEKGKEVECKVHAKPLYCATIGTAHTEAKRSAGECRCVREAAHRWTRPSLGDGSGSSLCAWWTSPCHSKRRSACRRSRFSAASTTMAVRAHSWFSKPRQGPCHASCRK